MQQRNLFQSLDWFTIALYVALLALGWMCVCGASYDVEAQPSLFDLATRSGKQLMWIGTAFVLAAVLLAVDERVYESLSPLLYAAFMGLLLVTPLVAHDTKGSLSWIDFGVVKLQPAEFAKAAVALCVSRVISTYNLHLDRTPDLLRAAAVVLLPILLIIMERETGSALVYLAFFLMFYREGMAGSLLFAGFALVFYFVVGIRYANVPLLGIAEASLGTSLVMLAIIAFAGIMVRVYTPARDAVYWILGGGLSASALAMGFARYVIPFNVALVELGVCLAIVAYLLWLAFSRRLAAYGFIGLFALGSMGFFYSSSFVLEHVMQPHQRARINLILGLDDDPRGIGYNVNQAKIAIGSGGFLGKGFMHGTQTKLRYVPEQDTDFIYCTVGEEQGFVGSAAVLLLFLALIWRLIHLAERQTYRFGRVYGYCVLSIFLFHLFINVGMVLGLTPVIGIPLPFFSYGGSSLWGFTILLFIFLRIDASRGVSR